MPTRILSLILISLLVTTACSYKSEFYVSPNGNDLNSGTSAKPFATIGKATEAVRDLLVHKQKSDITVFLKGGVYQVSEPIVFKPEDSGRDDFQVIYKAIPGERPIISGGVQIKNWKQNDQGIWVAKAPEINGKPWVFRELFIDSKRSQRARHPNEGYLHVAKVGEDKRTNFFFNQGDFPKADNFREVELVLLHDWSITRIDLKEIDYNKNKITAIDSIGAKCLDFFTIGNWEQHPRYMLENSLAFLDQPFEWYLDSESQLLYLMLPKGKNPKDLEIIAPYARSLVSLTGSDEKRIRSIKFEGITFSHCSYILPEDRYTGIQACHFDPGEGETDWNVVSSAVEVSWADNCSFEDCTFTHFGGSGLRFGAGSQDCVVSNSTFSDISGNGIMIGEGLDRLVDQTPWWKIAPEQVALGNRIENCVISETGQQFFGAVGIWCGITAQTVLKNNIISNLPYTGISVGWHWSPEPTPCREVRIEGNHIHHIMKILSDGGGIYVLGLQPDGKIINNQIHDVDINAGRAESNGMFLDEGTTNFTIANNLVYNIAKSPLRFHRATTNLVKDNVLVCGENVLPIRYNRTEEQDIVKEGNLILMESSKQDMSTLETLIARWVNK